MNKDEVKKIVDELVAKDVAFSLMIVAKEDNEPCDQYYFFANKQTSAKDVVAITLGDIALQLLDSGNTIDKVKDFFETMVDEAVDWQNERENNKMC